RKAAKQQRSTPHAPRVAPLSAQTRPAIKISEAILTLAEPLRAHYREPGLDHGVGHFRTTTLTRQRRLLAYHFIAMRHEGLCQVFLRILSPQPIESQSLINYFYFNALEEQ